MDDLNLGPLVLEATSVTRLAIYCTLDNFSKPVATIILPKSTTFLCNFWKGVKTFIFLMKSFWAIFIDISTFYWSHWKQPCHSQCFLISLFTLPI